jgi:UDP-N-acetylglucosamine 2-epimerase (non-hydrolysing)
MLDLVSGAFAVVTDSGGLQEETTVLGIPCLTVRENTERPITICQGTNRLVPDPRDIPSTIRTVRRPKSWQAPEGWDGRAAERVVQALIEHTHAKVRGAMELPREQRRVVTHAQRAD